MHNYMKRRSQSRNDPDQSSRVHRSDRSKRKVVVDASSTTSSVTSTTVYPHVMVQHNYHDHTNDPVAKAFLHDDDGMVHDADATNLRLFNMSFPIKLYEMLEKVEHDGNADVISWQPHGRCFSVHKPDTFKKIMSHYFKLSKISSFQRQLNLYGFSRLTAGLDKNGYYHEYFLRGRPDLVTMIHRNKVKGTGVRPKSNPMAEPDLYSYPPVDSEAALFQGCSNSFDTWMNCQMYPEVIPDTNSYGEPQEAELSDMYDDRWKPIPDVEKMSFPTIVEPPRSLMDMMMYGGKTSDMNESCHVIHPLVDDAPCSMDVNFDRLLDEMFCRDQTLDFKDLLKLATI